MNDNVVAFISPVDKLVEHAASVLNLVKAGLARNDPGYLLSPATIDHYLKIFTLSKDYEFTHQPQMVDAIIAFNNAIKDGGPWTVQFRSTLSARKSELEAMEKARAIEERGKVKRYTFEECKPGEYATYDKNGLPAATFLNAQLIFRDLGIVASYNIFTEKRTFLLHGQELHIGKLRNLMWDFCFVDFPHKVLENAIAAYSMRFEFHPVKDYFESIRKLSYEGGLIDTWLTKTVGALDTELNREIGKKMLVAIVTRIYKPGSKFDQMIVFEGSQGLGKSTLLEVLVGTEYFNSGKILQMDQKEQMEALKGRMIYESAELVGHGRTDVDTVKAFLSSTADRGRWAYGTEVKDHPRTAIIVGTTNKDNYLLDETGNRRIWPVECCVVPTDTMHDGVLCSKEANIAWLIEHRDLLFREALHLYESGYSLVMNRALWKDMAAIQSERMADIPLTDNVMEVFAFTEFEGLFIKDEPAKGCCELRIFTKDVIDQLFPSTSSNMVIGRQVKSAMLNIKLFNTIKWEYKKSMMINGVVNTGYVISITDPAKRVQMFEMIEARRNWRKRRNINGATTIM